MFHASSVRKMASFTKDTVKGVQRQAVDDGGMVPSCLSVLLNLLMCLRTHTHTHTHTHIYIPSLLFNGAEQHSLCCLSLRRTCNGQQHTAYSIQHTAYKIFRTFVSISHFQNTFCLHFSESFSSLSQDPHQDTVSIWYYKDKPTKVPSLADVHVCVVCLS
jgi:hypothetical protein